MRVGLDLHVLSGPMQGSRTYIMNLAKRLPAAAPDLSFIYYVPPKAMGLAKKLAPGAANLALRPIPQGRLGRLLWPFPARLAREADVFHCQYLAPPFAKLPCVVSLHDVLHEIMPALYPRGLLGLMRLLYPLSARRASMVLTGSQFSRQAIIERYKVPGARVAYAHYGVGGEYSPVNDAARLAAARQAARVPDGPYILYVGRIEPRKNLACLAAAQRKLRAEMGQRAPWLVLAGEPDPTFRGYGERALAGLRGEGVILAGRVADEHLPALYSGAAVFAYPSLGEGFGLPLAEAMACGAPVVASLAPALPEVADGAALLTLPGDCESLAAALRRVLEEPDLAEDLRRKGLSRAKHFTWERAVELALEAYRQAAQGRANAY